MMVEELGILPEYQNPILNGLVTFVSFSVFGIVPIIPFIVAVIGAVEELNVALTVSCILLSGCVLVMLGVFKSQYTQ